MFFSFFAMGHTSINIQVVLVLTINSGRLKYILFQKKYPTNYWFSKSFLLLSPTPPGVYSRLGDSVPRFFKKLYLGFLWPFYVFY
jgi:hypothetical protein